MTWLLWLGLLVGVLVAAAIGLTRYGAKHWADLVRTHTSHMESARVDGKGRLPSASRYDARELQGLPAPVQLYSTALLPSQGVKWQAVDDTSANATIVDGPITLTLLFRFNEAHLISSVRAESRGAGMGKDMVMLPWDCSYADYQPQHGMLIPMSGEAAWMRPDGRKAYFFGYVKRLGYEFLP